MVKRTVPAERLLHIHLEDGLGWEQICPFLGVPIPNEDYPDRNQPARFQAIAQGFLQPLVRAAMTRFASIAVPSLGVLGWAAVRYGPSLSKASVGKF
jgi:hypothetical protein